MIVIPIKRHRSYVGFLLSIGLRDYAGSFYVRQMTDAEILEALRSR